MISMVLDCGGHNVTCIKGCEVCCKPLGITYTTEDDILMHFEVRTLE